MNIGRPRGGLARAGAMAWALLGIAGLALFGCWAVGRLMPVVLPFAVAVLLSTLLRPGAGALRRRGWRCARAAIVAGGVAVLALGAAIALILPAFLARLGDLGTSLQAGVERVAYSL